jgi:hypothetical protein
LNKTLHFEQLFALPMYGIPSRPGLPTLTEKNPLKTPDFSQKNPLKIFA